MRRHIREVIVVEGRYDKNAVKQVVDATVVETGGFGVFKDRERLALLRRLAADRGLILLTDSDGAGFVIRNFLKGAIPKSQLKHFSIGTLPLLFPFPFLPVCFTIRKASFLCKYIIRE